MGTDTRPKALVLSGYGINCENETAFALQKAGADASCVHLNDLISGRKKLDSYQMLVFPGGFSFGDDLGSGKVLANKFLFRLSAQTQKFVSDGKLAIGICNGFQVMVKLGILPEFANGQETTLTSNVQGRFEDRWVYLKANKKSPCIFTKGIDRIYLPVRHGEGNFIVADDKVLKKIDEANLIALQYCDASGKTGQGPAYNPNGSVQDIAGICDKTGRVFGLMPHPEGHIHYTHHPRWTRMQRKKEDPEEGDGYAIFQNAVQFAQKELL